MNIEHFDAYDIAEQIKKLWINNVNKSSGNLTKDNLQIPLCVQFEDKIINVSYVEYKPNIGIILK